MSSLKLMPSLKPRARAFTSLLLAGSLFAATGPLFAAELTLVRYGAMGQEKPGLIDNENQIRDLSAFITDITPDQLSDESLARIADIPLSSLPVVSGNPRLAEPVSGVQKIVAIGFNY